jgi:hypothetical protein
MAGRSLLGAAASTAAVSGISGGLELFCSRELAWVIARVGGIQATTASPGSWLGGPPPVPGGSMLGAAALTAEDDRASECLFVIE